MVVPFGLGSRRGICVYHRRCGTISFRQTPAPFGPHSDEERAGDAGDQATVFESAQVVGDLPGRDGAGVEPAQVGGELRKCRFCASFQDVFKTFRRSKTYSYNPETEAKRRLIVLADSPSRRPRSAPLPRRGAAHTESR